MKTRIKQFLFLISISALFIVFAQTALSDGLHPPYSIPKSDLNYSTFIYAQKKLPNLRFGSINVHSQKGTYDIIAFHEYEYSVSVFSENASIKNVRVRAGIVDGDVFYDKTFAYIPESIPKRIEFRYTMPVGTYTMYIEVDPENTIAESDETDNITSRTFTAEYRLRI